MNRTVDILETPIEYLKGVGPARGDALKKELGIFKFYHLLHHFPFRYVDKSRFYLISEIHSDNTYVQLKGEIISIQKIGKPRAQRLVVMFKDTSGTIELVWFKGIKWMEPKLKPGETYIIFGKPSYFNNKINIVHPEIETATDFKLSLGEKLYPVYSSTEKLKSKGLDSKGISKIMKTLLMQVKGHIYETFSFDIINNLKLIPREEAFLNIHFPTSEQILNKSLARLKFEELFFIQLNLLKLKLLRLEKFKGHKFTTVGKYFNDFYNHNLPFELTNAQKKVIKEIRTDIGSGKQMNRLLQGDVGSGKTLVALMSMLNCP